MMRSVQTHIRANEGLRPSFCVICAYASAWKSALRWGRNSVGTIGGQAGLISYMTVIRRAGRPGMGLDKLAAGLRLLCGIDAR